MMVGLVVAAVLLSAAPAEQPGEQGVGEGGALIRGPGMERPLEVAGQPFFDLVHLAGLMPESSPPAPGSRVPEPATGRPGIRYDVLYSFPMRGQGPIPVVQELYVAPGGEVAWTHTRPGQAIPLHEGGELPAPGGWWRSRVLADFLGGLARAEGIAELGSQPAETGEASPLPGPDEEERAARDAETEQATAWRTLVGLVALGALLLVGALGSRARRESQ